MVKSLLALRMWTEENSKYLFDTGEFTTTFRRRIALVTFELDKKEEDMVERSVLVYLLCSSQTASSIYDCKDR
jgi:hypothetical protein